MSLGLSPAGVVATRVAERAAWEHHECLRGRPEVHIPAAPVKSAGEGTSEVLRVSFVGFELEGRPGTRLVSRDAFSLEPTDLADDQFQALQGRPRTQALRYESALDHERLLPVRACAVP